MSLSNPQTIRDLFKKKLENLSIDEKTSKAIEQHINEFSIEYAITHDTPYLLTEIYNSKVSDILSYLEKKSSPLLLMIKNKTLDISKLSKMTPDELNPEQFAKIKTKKQKEKSQKAQGTTLYKCSKCKRSNSRLIEHQMRSGDEPPTIFVECLECGYKYRL